MVRAIIAKTMPGGGASALPVGWDAARARLEGLSGGGLNIAHEAVDRYVAAGHGAQHMASARAIGCFCTRAGCQNYTRQPLVP